VETQQSGHFPRSEPEIKDVRSSAKDGATERPRYGTGQKEEVVQLMSEVAARRIIAHCACLASFSLWCSPCPSSKIWVEMAGQIPRGPQLSDRSPIV